MLRRCPPPGATRRLESLAGVPPQIVDPALAKPLTIAATPVLPNALTQIMLGDVLQLFVRTNPPDEPGLLYFKGNLLRASMPPEIQPGDRLSAKVLQQGDQVVLKLLDVVKGTGAQQTDRSRAASLAFRPLLAQLESLFRTAGLPIAPEPQPLPQPGLGGISAEAVLDREAHAPAPAPLNPSALNQQIGELLEALGSSNTFSDAAQVLERLHGAARGSAAATLRDTAGRLRAMLSEHSSAPPERMLFVLREELATLLVYQQDRGILDAGRTARLVQVLEQELTERIELVAKRSRDVLKQVLGELKTALAGNTGGPLEQALHLIDAHFESTPALQKALDPRTSSELSTLASRLEQLAGTMDALTQLNPLLQALGDPLMILFPFVLQGFLGHAEISYAGKKASKKKKPGEDSEEEEEEESRGKGGSKKNFDRIHLSVPLPAMGSVEVELAQRSQELMLRFTLDDKEACDFLMGRMGELQERLTSQGFAVTACFAATSAEYSGPVEEEKGRIA